MPPTDDDRQRDRADAPEVDGLPTDDTPSEEVPRREASAEFVVSSEASSDVRLREAMDPANQSLTDALRLSFRLLQVGILALLGVFLFSGFQTVEEGDVGVRTRFGAIVGDQGLEQIGPGLHPFWPYPVGEVVIVPQTREVELRSSFWPMSRDSKSAETGTRANIDENRSENTQLRPGIDGYLITAGGDIAHCDVKATYQIADAASYLRELEPTEGDRLVRYALERGVVLSAAELTLEQFTTLREEPSARVRERAQEILDSLDSGIDLVAVQLSDATEPLAIRSQFRDVQKAREEAKEAIDRAGQEVATEFTRVAGESAYADLLVLINDYSLALTSGDQQGADEVMASIGARFEASDIGGDAAQIINRAKAYQSKLETRLVSELRKIRTLSPTFRENPRDFSRRLWLQAYRDVFSNDQLEVFSVPLDLAKLDLAIKSSEDIMQLRRDSELERKRFSTLEAEGEMIRGFQWGRSQMVLEGPGRRLERDASGGLGRADDGN